MLISKINTYCTIAKNHQGKKANQTFKGNLSPKECFKMSNSEFFYKYGGYKGILTYNEISSLKELAEKSKSGNYIPNVAYAIFPDAVGDCIVATSQDDLLLGTAKWTDVSDYDNV